MFCLSLPYSCSRTGSHDKDSLCRGPECEATDAVENNGRAEKVELSFRTEDDPSLLTSRPLTFHIGTASGDEYLIGTREEQPIVSVITNTGVPSGTPAGYTIKVELQALKALIKVG